MKKYALYTRKLGVCGGCWLFGSNLVLSANVMKLGALRRAFSFEGRQELAPVKAFKCKSPTAPGRELHGVCKGPSGKEQRKGTLSVANLVNEKSRPS